jgi:hypothetical protein
MFYNTTFKGIFHQRTYCLVLGFFRMRMSLVGVGLPIQPRERIQFTLFFPELEV